MSIVPRWVAPLMIAGAAAVAVAVAPTAAAADEPHLVCTYSSTDNSQCETPGNSQLVATPPDVTYQEQYPYVLGAIVVPGMHGHGVGGHR